MCTYNGLPYIYYTRSDPPVHPSDKFLLRVCSVYCSSSSPFQLTPNILFKAHTFIFGTMSEKKKRSQAAGTLLFNLEHHYKLRQTSGDKTINYNNVLEICNMNTYGPLLQNSEEILNANAKWKQSFFEEFVRTNPNATEKARIRRALRMDEAPQSDPSGSSNERCARGTPQIGLNPQQPRQNANQPRPSAKGSRTKPANR